MLTKEECNNALDRVARFCSWFSSYECPEYIKLKNELDILDKFIDECFSNQPLTLEELENMKIGTPIWDDNYKQWLIFEGVKQDTDEGEIVLTEMKPNCYYSDYYESQFYRKEAQE